MHPAIDLVTSLPWKVFTSPAVQWDRLPTFVLGEYAILLAAALGLAHAVRRGPQHVLVWIAALIAGTANDLIFMALPLVDNFWHAQATIMLTPRLPLYIPCLYVLFLYYPTVAIARLGKARWAAAGLTGLLAVSTYAPFDIVGAKFLWWTWHDTDAPIRARILGVPASSTLWVLTFTGAFVWWVTPLLTSGRPTGRAAAVGLAKVAGLTTLTMMLQMVPLQQLDGGSPGYVALGTGLLLYAVAGLRGKGASAAESGAERLPFAALVAYFAVLATCIVAFDPARHVSTGVHETTGPCDVMATDLSGHTRRAYLCAREADEAYSFDCVAPPPDGSRWYTVCGKAHTNRALWMESVVGLCLVAIAGYARTFLRPGGSRPERGSSDATS